MQDSFSIYSEGDVFSGTVYFWKKGNRYFRRTAFDQVIPTSKKLYMEAYKLHLEQTGKGNCDTCLHYKPDNPYCECCIDMDKYEKEE